MCQWMTRVYPVCCTSCTLIAGVRRCNTAVADRLGDKRGGADPEQTHERRPAYPAMRRAPSVLRPDSHRCRLRPRQSAARESQNRRLPPAAPRRPTLNSASRSRARQTSTGSTRRASIPTPPLYATIAARRQRCDRDGRQDAVSAATKTPDPLLLIRAEVLLDRARFSPGVVDGKQGTNLKHAVMAYQSAHDIDPSGEIDADTWKALSTDAASASARPAAVELHDHGRGHCRTLRARRGRGLRQARRPAGRAAVRHAARSPGRKIST